MSSGFPQRANLNESITKTILSRAGNNTLMSEKVPWIDSVRDKIITVYKDDNDSLFNSHEFGRRLSCRNYRFKKFRNPRTLLFQRESDAKIRAHEMQK